MPDQSVAVGQPPFDDAAEMRRINVALLAAMEGLERTDDYAEL